MMEAMFDAVSDTNQSVNQLIIWSINMASENVIGKWGYGYYHHFLFGIVFNLCIYKFFHLTHYQMAKF